MSAPPTARGLCQIEPSPSLTPGGLHASPRRHRPHHRAGRGADPCPRAIAAGADRGVPAPHRPAEPYPLSFIFEHPGPITRTVEDAALMLGAMAGYDPDDCSTVRMPVEDYTANLRASIHGLRVDLPCDWFFDRLENEVRATVEAAILVLRHLGARGARPDHPRPRGGGARPPPHHRHRAPAVPCTGFRRPAR